LLQSFTAPARDAIWVAEARARELGQDSVRTEHLLFALLELPGLSDRLLEAVGLVRADLMGRVQKHASERGQVAGRELPLSLEVRRALEHAAREARILADGSIRPEHLLLGLAVVHEGVAAQLLRESGVDDAILRVAIAEAV
jgi:ATP-dependent Clp protease ATP-binding subunit ClpC